MVVVAFNINSIDHRGIIDFCRIFSRRFIYIYIILTDMNQKISSNSKHEIPLSIVIFMLIIFFLSKNSIFITVAFVIGLLSLLSDKISYYISWVWQRILRVIGFINAHILLGLVFFVVLLPISLLYRIMNKDSLNLKAGKKSYYLDRDHLYTAKDIENPW